MSEVNLSYLVFGCSVGISIGCLLYSLGGRDEFPKSFRRFGGSFVLSLSLWIAYFLMGLWNWWLLLLYPLTVSVFVLGYGSNILLQKIFKRSYIVIASLISSVGICVLYGESTWFILPAEVIVAGVTVYLGVKNPIQAASEEFFVCAFLWMPKLMYPFFTV